MNLDYSQSETKVT